MVFTNGLTKEERFDLRLQILKKLKEGQSPFQIAKSFNISKQRMNYYIQEFKNSNIIKKVIIKDSHPRWEVIGEYVFPEIELNSKDIDKSKRESIYRKIWLFHYSDITAGNHIHHINLNKNDNNISNLMSLSCEEHLKLHRELEKRLPHITKEICKDLRINSNQDKLN